LGLSSASVHSPFLCVAWSEGQSGFNFTGRAAEGQSGRARQSGRAAEQGRANGRAGQSKAERQRGQSKAER
jgi:hypothetical protein